MKTRLGFVGTGRIARIHAESALRLPDVEIVAAVNPHRTSLDSFADTYHIEHRFASVTEMVSAGDVDAVVINTPNFRHKTEATTALEAGMSVLVEKPMTMNYEEARQLAETASRSQGSLMVAQNWRWDEEVRWLRDIVEKNKVGTVVRTHARAVHVNWGPSGWFTRKELAGGGALIDMGVHAIDATRFVLGDPLPVNVFARIGTHYISSDVDDTALLIIEWENGAVSTIDSGWWQPHADGEGFTVGVHGTMGYASVLPTIFRTHDREKGTIHSFDPGFRYPRADFNARGMYDNQMAAFIACARHEQPPFPDIRSGLVTMQIIDAAYRSAATGKVVYTDETQD